MDNEEKLTDLELELSPEEEDIILRAYVRTHMGPASNSVFDEQVEDVGITKALRHAVINEMVNVIIEQARDSGMFAADEQPEEENVTEK